MSTDLFVLDGRAYSWRRLRELRQQQLAAARKAQGSQLALFEMKEDCRPAAERTAAGRFTEPTLLGLLADREH